ncbi:Ig-like domain-containing protein [Escherichia coli]|nr:Ig-like domain-containing protein [Escherichia coli]EMA8597780.1 Ig-like domain-containing protein [Escherichia coli]
MSLIIDVISRKTSVKQTLINPGDVTVVIYEPSVVQVHAQASAVARYVREGNDLLIYMQDGTVIRCNGYFLQAANTAEQSELVFADGQQLTHITFADTAAGGLAPVELTAQTTAIESIAPFLDTVAQTSAFPWGWLAGAAVGGGALGALLASGGDGDSKTEVINNPTPPAEPGNATPSFLVTDNQGDQRGILATNDITDDTTPTFSGSGQAGATIQIKDSNGNTIASTQVDNNGHWSVSLPTQSAGEHTWSVVQIVGSTITDAGSITLTIDNSQASVQVATTAGDNIINASEQAAGFTLSGTSSHLAQGTELTVTLNGKTYTTTVGANGAWSVQVPTADAQALGEGNQAVLVSGKDTTGNTVTGAQLLTVDTQPPTLAINTIAQDNIISAAEHNVALVLSGTSNAEAGQTVTLTVNGKSHTATVGSDGTWQVTLPATEVQALAEGNYAVNASVSDRAGNTTSHSANFTVDTSAPVVSVNTVAGDDILNNAEQAVAQIISGQVSGASPGDTVTVKLGTHVLTGIVLADGSWNVALDPAVTRTLDRGANTIFVTVTDAAGNTGAASRAITLVGVSPLITINTVSGDDIISGAEKGAPLTLTGSTQQAETGQTVTVTLAGQSFTTTVQADGSWSLTVPAAAMGNLPDGEVAITASVTDLSGNTGNTSRTITVDSQAPALSIDPLTADNIINAAESGQDLPITGTTDAQPGQTVTVTLNGQTYQGVVQPDGTWSVTVPAANVDALADGNATVTASVNDVAGNPTSVSRVALVDATPPVVTINPVATDNVINTPEHIQAQIISGTVTGAQAGDIVTVTLNNVDYTTVVDGSGNWSLGVPASVVSGLADGSYPVSVSVTDKAGNTGSQSLTVTVNTAAPLIGINSIAGDDVINASEKGADLQITGTSDQPVNTAITVTLNGQNYTTTTDASGNWSVTVPASAVTALGQANYTVTAAVTSSIGNSTTASHNVLVDSALPGVTINPVATDDIINAAEAGVAQTISGQVTGAAVGDAVTVTLGGNNYTTTVQAGLSWSVDVPADAIQALGNGDLTVNASVTNQNGNTGSGTRDITIDANLPGLRVDTVAGDDVVNIIEHGQALVVTGSSLGLAEGTPLTVTINDVEYTTAVQADGSWSVGITAAQVSAWPAGAVNIAVSGESSAGNPISITHPVTVDLTPAAITINTIATDDVINAAEKGANLTLSGTTTNVEAGQTVTVTFGGKNYTASVAGDGSWTATVPAADLAALPEGSASAQASVSNINGNSASAVHSYSVDSSAPTIIINTVASDNIVNASEADAGVTVSGSTTAEAGQIVTVTLNSPTVQTYQATVQADGSWSINIPAADLEALTDGSHTLTATVNDKAGNPASTTHNLAVDLTVPVLTINTIAGDDIINATEHGQALVISGSSTGGEAGDVVTVTLNSKTYTTTLDASGNWSVGVPAADVTALGSGPQTVTATVTDAAGNSDSETHTVTVNLTAPTIGINTIATDDVINATEKGADLQISGTSNQPAGTTITLTLNGQNYTATTDASGNWSTTVPASAVGALGEASYTVTANVTDSAGNSNSASHNVQVNTALPGVTLNPVASDDIINAAESGVAQTISGQVTGAAAGDTVTVTLGGKTYTATVQGNLSWSVDVPAADIQAIGNGELTVNAWVTNGVGNTGSGSRDITIDANLPGLRVDTVAGDDVVNSIEHGQALVITGSSSGLAAGAALTVVINNVTYGATVLADGTWSLGVPAANVGNWPAGTVNITVSGATSAGNPVTITHPVTVDLAAVAISINTVSGDDVINAAEKGADLTLSGSTSGVEPGQTVTVTFDGKTYTATVAGDGSWTTTVPAADLAALRDGDATVQASVSTINGNTASATHVYSVDATTPTLTINTIATDDILNAAEAGNPLTISGSSTAEAGQTVTVTLNGVTYTGTVQADGSWSVSVPTADLSNLTASQYTVSASVNDKAGNPVSATHGLAVDLTVPVLTINTVSGDDIINATEHGQALVISGSSTGGEAGDVITVTLNSKTYTTTLDASGNWSVGVPLSDVTALGSGPQNITATITDAAGNSDDASRTVTVNLAAPTIGINTIATDDVINATEKGADLQITGTSNQPAGTTITVTLNGQNYTATTDASGNWSATVPASAVSALGEANYTVTANVTDKAGNSNSASHNVLVNSALPAVTINAVATDDIINADESDNAQTISGQVTGAAAGDTVTVTLGGNTYTATVQANLSWSISVPAADIQALGNGDLTINALVTNGVGNTGSGSRDITIDANLPGLRVDTVAGDDVINSIEHNQALVITGSSTGLTAGTALTVEINNVTYAATVLADGTWSLGVPAVDVSNWPAGTVNITVSGTNSAGTTSTITHPVTVDLAAVAITINTLSGDDVINAVEKGETLVVSGSTSGVEAGQTVTVTFGGKNYTTTVEANGSWTVNVPPADLAALPDGAGNVQASVSNINGNNAQADRAYSVDATAPLVTINTIASDDTLNVSEAGAGITISGTTTAQAGQTLTVTLNNNTYQTTVQADGTWSVNVPAADLSGLTASSYTVTATVSDKAGNPASADHALAVDVTAPDLTINTVAGDDIINAIEHGQALVVSGTSTGAAAGDVVTVNLNGKNYTTTLDASGNWSVGIPAADVTALATGSQTITASLSDRAGNSDSTTHNVTVDLSGPTLTISIVSGDDIINNAEKTQDLIISGGSSGLATGTTVTVMLNGLAYSATTDGSGNWSVTVPASAVGALGEAVYQISASATDSAGNSGITTHTVNVESLLPGVIINTVAGDDIINAAEIGVNQTISGQVTGTAAAGDTVTVTLGGNQYVATVQPDLSWSVSVPANVLQALGNGELTISASVTNSANNTGTTTHDIVIDANLPGLRVDTVAGDDVINSIEHTQALVITGSSSGLAAGAALTVVINSVTYGATVLADGSWSVGVPAADVTNWPAGTVNIAVSGTNTAGTTTSITHPVTVDLAAVAITINPLSTDDVINAAEKGSDLQLSGTTSDVEAGQTITVIFGGKSYTTTVAADNTWGLTIPAADLAALPDGAANVQASVSSVAGNSAQATHVYSVDATAPSVTINTIAADDILNAAEAGSALIISGTSTTEAGQTVTVTLNGVNYSGNVQADGSWSVSVPTGDLANLTASSYTVNASVSDKAGNPASATHNLTVDLAAPVVTINTVAGDDIINATEHGQAQIISGSATGATTGNTVSVTIGTTTYTTVLDANGNWSIGVPASVISGLADGTVTISATITDSAGNSSTQTHNVQVNTAAVSLSVSTISGDNIINAAEAGSALTLSGTGTNFATGTVVTVLLNGKGYSATIQSNGSWSVNVPAADVAALSDGTSYTVSASAQDSAGNSATASRSVAVDLTAPVISINTVSTDDRLNAAEQQQPLTLNGSTSAEVGQTVTVTFGGKTYTATVAANGTWALNVPAADLAALGQGAQTITASVNDRAGNPGQATHALTVDTVAPTVTIATVAGDDIINNAEQLAGQTISGTTTAEVGQTVTVTFNGQSWSATVGSGGSWSVFIPAQQFAGLSDGSYTISATVSDQAGNPGSASRGVTLNGDVPTVTINTFAGDDVVNAAEHGSSLVISGTTTAPVGQTLTLTLNGKTYTTTVQTGGSWSYTLGSADVTALADGNAYVINASVSNAIGNTGSSNHTITVDLSAPAMGINIDSLQADTGLSASDFITSVSPVVVNGSLTAALASNETAQISIDGGTTWTTLTVTGTTWRYNDSRTLTDGNYLYQVRVIDAAGNVGATDSQNVVIDTTAPDPAVKTIAISAITTDTGLITNDFVTSDTTLAVSGTLGATLSAGEFAQISIDGGTTWQNLSVSGLTWSYLDGRTLTDGNYNYQVRVIDTAGNIGATASQIVTVDTTAPLASKTIAIASISDDTGLSSSDFVTRDTTLTVRGTLGAALAADERAQISLDGGVTWTTLTVIGTSWSYADGRTLTDGTWNYTVRVVDLAGNVGQTATQNVVVDTTSPEAAKSITITGISDDTGTSSSDFITSDTTLTVRGVLGAALGANEFAQISTDNGATWVNVTLAADGLNWSYVDGRTLTNGTTTWQVRVVDLAGNVGATGSQSAQIDTVNPAQVLTIASISTDTGSSATDFITSDTSLTLTGSLGAGLASGEVAQISLDGGATWTTLTTNGTQWTYTDSRTLTDGSYVYQVRVLDLAGNTGPVVSKTVVVDTINPTATPGIVSYTDDVGQRQGTLSSSQATDDTTPLLNGVLSAPLASGEVVYLYRNGLLLGAVTMVGALNWTYSDSGLVSGAYTYSARVVDLAGNITSSSDFVLTVDTSIPTTLAQITSQTTRDTTPIISGVITAALASGQYVEVVINGKTYTSEPGGAVVVDPAHNTWYVQLPDTDALTVSATAYTVTAQVKSSAGNGNNANISNGTVTVNAAIDYTPTWTTASKTTAWGLTYGLDSHGMWTVLANQQVMQSTDPLTWSKTALTLYQSGNNYATSSIADYDRNGTGDLFITRDDYGTGYINGFTNNGDGTFSSAIQVTVGTLTWYGSIVAFDKEGDGYLDFWIGDAGGPDSNTFLWNNAGTLVGNSTTSNSGGSATVGGAVTGYLSLNEGSGVDLNNDGRIDLVQHTYNLNNYYTLSSLINQGNGTFVWGQNTTNTFLSGAGSGAMSSSVSMTWADFDGDGDMDLFLPASQGRANYGSLLFNTNGVLGSPVAVGATATTYASQFSLAVDWNHDGLMDIARIAQTGQSYLYTNVGGASNWTQSALGGSQSGTTSGVAAMDYDWDGAVDVLVTKQSGSVFLIRNTNTVSYGTSLHLRITDPNGINVYYGNTVKLYNSAGVLVATQIINPQSGMGVNDTSALVNFYGLNAGETYNAVLIKSTGTTASNIDQTVNTSWGGLQATDATHAYDLSAEAGTASNNGKFVGTGYNDTFFATAGTDTYDGSGGWVYSSGTGTWLANGGMDVVDFRLSTVGVTANLSSTAAQATGFNTSTFTNIEGISGSNFNDTLTGSSGDNQLEGRGGNDTLNIGNGGHDTLLYKLLNASDATGGNGSDVVNGFTVGTWEGTADTDRIDIRELLQGSGYTGNGKASYVNGVATLDAQAGNIGDFVKVTQSGSDTIVQIDRDGTGGTFATTNVVTLTGVHTDLATLLANHQLMVV